MLVIVADLFSEMLLVHC